jgi:putative hemolysin
LFLHWSIEIAFVLGLIVLGGAFAGAEIAIVSVRASRLRELADASHRGRALHDLRANPERFLATVQVGITVIGATAAAFGGATLAAEASPFIARLGLSEDTAENIALGMVVVFVSYLSLVLGELVPKSLALKWPERYALASSPIIHVLARISAPVVWFLTASSNAVLRFFGDRTSFSESRISRDELLHLVDEAGEAGEVHPRASDIASRAIELGSLRVSAVMIPRGGVRFIALDAHREELIALIDEREEDRFVVARGPEDIVGYVTARDIAQMFAKGVDGLTSKIRPVHIVPETALALDVLDILQSRRIPIAIVVDESGSIEGTVDIDDLADEVVGALVAGSPETIEYVREADGALLISASARVHVVNRLLDLDLPQSPRWSTLGGLVLHEFGAMPPAGTSVVLADGTSLDVVEVSSRRIQRLRIHPGTGSPLSTH